MSAPLVTITAQQMFEMITRMETVTNKLVSGLDTLREIADDHEGRIRVVEQRADAEKRLDILETRVTQHDSAFTKQGERIGVAETEVRNLKEKFAGKATPAIITALVISGTSVLIQFVAWVASR